MPWLPWRLISYEVEQTDVVLQALSRALATDRAFVDCLLEQRPALHEWLESVGRPSGSELERKLDVDYQLAAELPTGMCERLMAVPLRHSGSGSHPVAVAAPEADSRFLQQEFEFQLQRSVRLVPAELVALKGALREIAESEEPAPNTAAGIGPHPDAAPETVAGLGLKRGGRAGFHDDTAPSTVSGLGLKELVDEAPSTISGIGFKPVSVPPRVSSERAPAPIPLVNVQAESPRTRRGIAPQPESPKTRRGVAPQANHVTAQPVKVGRGKSSEREPSSPPRPILSVPIEPALAAMELAKTPQGVVNVLAQGGSALAGRVLVFAYKNHELSLRAHLGVPEPDDALVVIRPRKMSLIGRVLEEALSFGEPGRLDDDVALRSLLDSSGSIGLAVCSVGDHPALLIALAEFEQEASAQQLSRLSEAAGTALTRIIQQRRNPERS